MGIEAVVVVTAIAFVVGVILTLRYMGGRPINVNVDARAEAHGGDTHVSTASVPAAPSGPNMLSVLKLLAIAAIVMFGAVMVGGIISKIGEPAKITVNVPQQAPPIVNVPKIEPPIINMPAQTPVVVAPVASATETISLIIAALMLIVTIVMCFFVFRHLNRQRREERLADWTAPETAPVIPATPGLPIIGYERTSYGWTPIRGAENSESEMIPAEKIVPGLFVQKP